MNEILGRSRDDDTLSHDQTAAITVLAKRTSYWKTLKKAGIAMTNGDQYTALENLLTHLADLGAFLVPVGELEQWHPRIASRDKNAWLLKIFEQDLHLRPPSGLEAFTRDYLNHLTQPPHLTPSSSTPSPP